MRLPLPRAIHPPEQSISLASGNAGLRHTKFADAWSPDDQKYFIFDRPRENQPSEWFSQFDGKKVGDKDSLTEMASRIERLVHRSGGVTVGLKNTDSRFVTGLGLQHPTKNGFAWHPTLGVPYLPGSGVKGAVSAYAYEMMTDEEREQFKRKRGDDVFGCPDIVGQFVFTDLIPLAPVTLVVEVMTPHYSAYYQDGCTPGDWHSPVPIQFLSVEAGQTWMASILPQPARLHGKGETVQTAIEKMREQLLAAFSTTGAGAKTEIGFGYFDEFSGPVKVLRATREQQENRIATEQLEAQQLDDADPQTAELISRQRTWRPDSDDPRQSITQFLDDLDAKGERLSQKAAYWLRDNYLQTTSSLKGIWANPDKKNKKGKPFYNANKAAMVKRVQAMMEPTDKPT